MSKPKSAVSTIENRDGSTLDYNKEVTRFALKNWDVHISDISDFLAFRC